MLLSYKLTDSVWFQLQVEPINRKSLHSKYVSVPQALRVILREEGLFAFWKGHVPAQAMSLVYGVIQVGSKM